MNEPASSQTESPSTRPRARWVWRSLGCLGVLALLATAVSGWWVAYRVAFHDPLPEMNEELEAFVEEIVDGEGQGGGPTIDVSGSGDLNFDRFAIHDRQGHEVLSVGTLRGHLDLAALREGEFRLRRGRASGVVITLRRGPSGRVSLAEVFRRPEAGGEDREQEGAGEGSAEEEPEASSMRMQIGPIRLSDVTVKVEMGDRPVRIVLDSARMSLRTRPEGGHRIRIWDVVGRLLEPDVFPLPVRVVDAEGSVRLGYGNLIDLKARTCIGRGELRTRVVLPARGQAMEMTIDARGVLGTMARMGLFIASARQPDRFRATRGLVQMSDGIPCTRIDALAERGLEEDGEDVEPRAARARRIERRSERSASMTGADAAEATPMRVRRREGRREQRAERRGRRQSDTE